MARMDVDAPGGVFGLKSLPSHRVDGEMGEMGAMGLTECVHCGQPIERLRFRRRPNTWQHTDGMLRCKRGPNVATPEPRILEADRELEVGNF
jgi:hypothetical protein